VSRAPEASRVSRIGPAFTARITATGLIPYLTAGYPSLERTLELLRAVERAGALAVEVGVPFSDPIADGPDIQRSRDRISPIRMAGPKSFGGGISAMIF